jgi:hypothetical protein
MASDVAYPRRIPRLQQRRHQDDRSSSDDRRRPRGAFRRRFEPHDPQDPSTEQLDEARLCVFPKPVGESHIFGPGQHKLELVVTAANADAVTYSTAISYPGGRTALLVSEPEATNRPLRDRLRAPIKRR